MKALLELLRHENIIFYLTLLVATTFLVPDEALNSIAIGLLTFIWIINKGYKNLQILKKKRIIFIFFLFYASFIIGTLYTENFTGAVQLLWARLPLVLFPLIYATINNFSTKQSKKFKNVFIAITLIAIIYCYFRIFLKWYDSGDPIIYLLKNYNYSYSYITNYIDLHPTYFSYFILISLIFIEGKITNSKTIKNKIYGVLIGLFFVLVLIHIGTRIALLTLMILFLIFIARNIYRKKIVISLALTTVLLLGILVASKYDFTVQRFKQSINVFIPQKGVTHSTSGYRLFTTKIFKREFSKHPIFGVGFANGNKYLDLQFDAIGFPHMKGKNYHNQYFQILIELGIVGFIVFMLNFLIPLRLSILKKNKELFMFIVITMLFLTVENMLGLHKGVTSYAFFNSLFVFAFANSLSTKNSLNDT